MLSKDDNIYKKKGSKTDLGHVIQNVKKEINKFIPLLCELNLKNA
jgi:hypothetical protein